MKKNIKRIIIIVLVFAFVYAIIFAGRALPILTGFDAKAVCSCVFVSGRNVQEVIATELNTIPFSLGSVTVNTSDSSVTASVIGLSKKTAIYRQGLGCTLLNDMSVQELRQQQPLLASPPNINPDTLDWPMGNKNAYSTPANINNAQLKKAVALAFKQQNNTSFYGTRAIVVLYKGQIVHEQYAPGFDSSTRQTGWSMTKSITNALVGILVKQGAITINDRNLFTEWQNDERSNITINNLLHANSGLQWREVYSAPSAATNMLYRKNDMAGYAMSFDLEYKPGEHFRYSSGTTNLLSYLVRRHTANNYYRFVYEQLFNKLGMYSAVMEPDASGTYVGSSYCFASARDWARFGLLYLNDGVVNGERILPEGWVKYTRTPAPSAKKGEYGAQFWLNAGEPGNERNRTYPDVPTDCFFAEGFQGQEVWIIPSKELVVVRLSLQSGKKLDENQFLAEVVGSIK